MYRAVARIPASRPSSRSQTTSNSITYQQPSANVRPVQTGAGAQANAATSDCTGLALRSLGGPSRVQVEHIRTDLSPRRVDCSPEGWWFSAVLDDSFRCSRLASPSTGKSRQTHPTSPQLPASCLAPRRSASVSCTIARASTTVDDDIPPVSPRPTPKRSVWLNSCTALLFLLALTIS